MRRFAWVVVGSVLSACRAPSPGSETVVPPPTSVASAPVGPEAGSREEAGSDEAPTQTRLEVSDDRLFLLGTFDARTEVRVREVLEAHPKITTLVFTANGGSVDDDATLALGRYVRERGLHTHLVSRGVIASGGVSLFLSGETRTIERGAKIGVHSWEHCWTEEGRTEQQCKQAMDHERDDPGHALHGDYTELMLGSRDFYWFAIAAAPSSSIHWMTDAEIESHGLATAPLSPAATAPLFGDAFEAERSAVLGD